MSGSSRSVAKGRIGLKLAIYLNNQCKPWFSFETIRRSVIVHKRFYVAPVEELLVYSQRGGGGNG